jgi:tetratricopeptide (TPR) repeat protein
LNREERFAEAEASAREALRLAPTLARAHEELGDIYFAWLGGADAFQCFREALRLNPMDRGLKLKTIRALENRLPILGKVWKFARHRSRTSSLIWLLYMSLALGGGLVSGFLGAIEVAAVFQFALVVPMLVIIVLFLILVVIDLVFTLGVINGWIRM